MNIWELYPKNWVSLMILKRLKWIRWIACQVEKVSGICCETSTEKISPKWGLCNQKKERARTISNRSFRILSIEDPGETMWVLWFLQVSNKWSCSSTGRILEKGKNV